MREVNHDGKESNTEDLPQLKIKEQKKLYFLSIELQKDVVWIFCNK